MMRKYGFSFTVLCFIILTAGTFLLSGAERDRSLIFEASFDDFSANASHAAGSKTVRGLPESDLQLRMFPGIGAKSNALVLSNAETCRWELKNNLDPRQGTISFWLRNLNWQITMPERQMFFYAYQGNFTLWIWKNWSPYVNVHINITTGGKNQSFTLAARVDPEQWNTQKWHKIDLTWDQ